MMTKRHPKMSSAEAAVRRRAFYLRLPRDTLRTIIARKEPPASHAGGNALISPASPVARHPASEPHKTS
jgi:hypothetical protein